MKSFPLVIAFFLTTTLAHSQEYYAQAQRFATPIVLNPAMGGFVEKVKLSMLKQQFLNAKKSGFKNYQFIYEQALGKNNPAGLGVKFYHNNDEAEIYKFTQVTGSYAKGFSLGSNLHLRAGAQIDLIHHQLNVDSLSGFIVSAKEKFVPDLSAGINLNGRKFFLGVSVFQITQPQRNFYGSPFSKEWTPRKINGYFGTFIPLTSKDMKGLSIFPNAQVTYSKGYHLISAGNSFNYKGLIWGVRYENENNQQKVIGLAGLSKFIIRLSYSDTYHWVPGQPGFGTNDLSLNFHMFKWKFWKKNDILDYLRVAL